MAFDHSSLRWLGISDLIAEPEGPPFISHTVAHAVWTGDARDTRPNPDLSAIVFLPYEPHLGLADNGNLNLTHPLCRRLRLRTPISAVETAAQFRLGLAARMVNS